MAGVLLEAGAGPEATFKQDAGQLVLKAYLFGLGRRYLVIDSVRELALECAESDSQFQPFIDYGGVLDRYYLAARYPDALPTPAVPFESFAEAEAAQALSYATEIVELVRAKVPPTEGEAA